MQDYVDILTAEGFAKLSRRYLSHLGISLRMTFQGYASGRPRANQN